MLNLAVVLVEPRHPGNLGSVARGMKNFGFTDLRLVNPCEFTEETYVLAHRSKEILDFAQKFSTLSEAIADCSLVFATSNKERLKTKSLLPRKAVELANESYKSQKIALVFGSESTGLYNSELDFCNYLIKIPMAEIYPSINLSQAVLILLYEFFIFENKIVELGKLQKQASFELKSKLANNVNEIVKSIDFMPKGIEKRFTNSISKSFARLPLTEKEVGILQMLFSNIAQNIKK